MEISQEDAKRIMDSNEDIVILDVRSIEEYQEGHIKNAICIPHDHPMKVFSTLLPNKNQEILIYCRSGHRALIAEERLKQFGYTNLKTFGGIITWPYEIVK